MEVEIASKEIIKPLSQTPLHLKTLNLSLFDQLSPHVYTPTIFFYPINNFDSSSHKIQNSISNLKNSLSETLTHFYFLAGRIKDNWFIDCTDEGALFLEATVNATISDFLEKPKSIFLEKLLPCSPMSTDSSEESVQIAIQLNRFSCGGIAISVCFLHKIIDGTSMSCFLKSWAEINRSSSKKIIRADYQVGSSLFPQPTSLPIDSALPKESQFLSHGKSSITRRFVFDPKSISNLKSEAKSQSHIQNPTRVELITAFIWKYALKAADQRSAYQATPSSLSHVVNLRRRTDPSLSDFLVGNLYWLAVACYDDSSSEEIEMGKLVTLLRESLEKINNDFIQKLVGEEGSKKICESLAEIQKLYLKYPNSYIFSSWCNMGVNEVDFGWGKPIWVSTAGVADSIMRNMIILMEMGWKGNMGIQAWVLLDEEEMDILEHDPSFLEYASLNPSIQIS